MYIYLVPTRRVGMPPGALRPSPVASALPPSMPLSTIFILNWIPLFTRPPTVEILLDAIRYRQQHLGWRIYGWVVLENHIHMIVHTNRLQPELAAFKSYTARRLIDYLTEHRVRRIQEILSDLHIDCDLCGSLLSNAESTLNDR